MMSAQCLGGCLAAIFALAACGGEAGESTADAGGGTPIDLCADYVKACPYDANGLDVCHAEGADGNASHADMTEEKCWFLACGAEVGKCDGQEPGDTSIEACASTHGWK